MPWSTRSRRASCPPPAERAWTGGRPSSPGSVHVSTQLRREAVAALLRIGGDCFTLSDINSTISGCGIKALAQEKEQFGYIRVIFPETAGVPPEFEQISQIILDIIPCHLEVEFYFRYLTWAECHAHGYTWAVVHQNQWTWQEFQLAI